jgi:hypothetical protein
LQITSNIEESAFFEKIGAFDALLEYSDDEEGGVDEFNLKSLKKRSRDLGFY